MDREIWKDIKGYEGKYQISNLGRVKSLLEWCGNIHKGKWINNSKIITPTGNGYGYLIIGLRRNQKKKNYYIHRLVAEAFIPNPNNLPVVNHKDYNKENNKVDNLEWCSQKDNIKHSIQNMQHPKNTKSKTTGEKFIYYRANKEHYRVVVFRKEYPSCKTLEEAIALRDSILKEVMKDGKFNPTR